jgi:shikimate kinase
VTSAGGSGGGPAAILIGPPGAGKSVVGALLADRLGVPFRDTDDDVAAAAGKPPGDIFIEDSEAVFRDLERAAAVAALSGHHGVLALGSGAVLDPEIQHLLTLRHRVVVYLETGFAVIARRTGIDRPRVVVPGNPRGRLREMLEQRRPVYERLAEITVPTDELAPEEIAADLAARIGGGAG